MLNLDTKLSLTQANVAATNLCDRFSDDELKKIGEYCFAGYDEDERSRSDWLRRNEAGMDLALQVVKGKTFPWPGCANVAFPLVTIASQQFHARAYPAIVSPEGVAKCKVLVDDPTGQITARGEKVSQKMNYQLLYEDKCWEDQMDKALLNVSIVGCNFKKSYRNASLKHNVSELVLAKDLILNYWAKSCEACPRTTQKIPLFRNDVYERVKRGTWRDVLEEAWYTAAPSPERSRAKIESDARQGITPPAPDDASALVFLEQHVDLDLDDDGYAEHYIITFQRESRAVVRIVCNFNWTDIEFTGGREVIKITKTQYFTKLTFIPSPDGGMYDIGFGVFLGPLNEAVNSLVNMLLDCGTMQTTGGGFLGRGAKIRGGVYTIAPFEWKRVDSTGDDLRKSIFPLPVNAPSDVLFQLLSLLINYASRVSGTTDITVGENPGQNTPAETSRTMVEMGQKIYTAVFKRIWRATKSELEKLYALNAVYLPPAEAELFRGKDYEICPVADPNITSETMRVQQAMTVKQSSMQTPGYNKDEVERRFLKALHVDAIDQIFPGTAGQEPPKDPKLVIQEVKEAGAMARMQLQLQSDQQQFIITMQNEVLLTNAKVMELQAQAQAEAANAQNEAAYAQVALINAEIGRLKVQSEAANKRIESAIAALKLQSEHELWSKEIDVKKTQKAAA